VNDRPKRPAPLSRRRFVAVIAAGSAALLAQPAVSLPAAAPPAAKPKPATAHKPAPPAPAMTAAQRKEYDRQTKSTAETLKTIRDHAMPPGTEMASIFRARRPAKKAN
jgi:hypothetical protein